MKSAALTTVLLLAFSYLALSQVAPAPAPSSSSTCTLTPELTEGPYYLDDRLLRANVTEGQSGVPFNLSIQVVNVATCQPVADAFVDIWHANALGVYSGFAASADGGTQTNNLTFLRGIVLTDSNGVATFQTIFPGWYQGRVTHIHVKVHVPNAVNSNVTAEYLNSHVVHTGQLFFNDSLITSTALVAPYSSNTQAKTPLTSDSIYMSAKPDLVNVTQVNTSSLQGTILAIVDPNSAPAPVGAGGGGVPSGGPGGLPPRAGGAVAPTPGSSSSLQATVSPSVAPTGTPVSSALGGSVGVMTWSCLGALAGLLLSL